MKVLAALILALALLAIAVEAYDPVKTTGKATARPPTPKADKHCIHQEADFVIPSAIKGKAMWKQLAGNAHVHCYRHDLRNQQCPVNTRFYNHAMITNRFKSGENIRYSLSFDCCLCK